MSRLALLLLLCVSAYPQAITNPSNPTNNPNQINVTTAYLYLNKLHYAGTWSSTPTYNSQDVVLYSSAAYISLQPGNVNNNPASASLWWVVLPGSGGGSSVWGGITGTLSSQTDLAAALAGKQVSLGYTPLNAANNLSDLASPTTARTNLGLGNVQNTALSSWAGTTSLTTLGTIVTGVWNGTAIGLTYLPTIPASQTSGFAAVATSGSASDLGTGTLGHARLPTLLSGDIPNNAANTSGLAGTATALASAPTNCSAGSYTLGINVSGTSEGCTALPAFPAGTVVGTTDTQTLTNKSIAGSEINSGTLPHAQLPTLLSGDIPNNAASTTGNAATATALAATPAQCSGGTPVATGIQANGTANCAAASGAYSVSQGTPVNVSVSSSPVAIFDSGSLGVALPSGACWRYEAHFSLPTPASGGAYEIWYGTSAGTGSGLSFSSAAAGPFYFTGLVCNANGTQTAQNITLNPQYSQSSGNFYVLGTGNQTSTSTTLHISITATAGGSPMTITPFAFMIGRVGF